MTTYDAEGFERLCDAIVRAQAEGSFRAGDPRQMALVAFSLVYGAVSAYIERQMDRLGFEFAEAQGALLMGGAFLVDGFRARTAPDG